MVKLRYFVGLPKVEAAQALGLSDHSVNYYWATRGHGSSGKSNRRARALGATADVSPGNPPASSANEQNIE